LSERGGRVRALVRDARRAGDLASRGIDVVPGDLTVAEDVRRAAEGCDVIYHIAAAYREARHGDDFYRLVNVEGTRHVLDAAREHGVRRVVHCSTVGVHGDVAEIPASETTSFNPGDIYQLTKLEGEQVVAARIEDGQEAVIFRPVGIYGPGDLRFLKLFKTIHRGAFRIIGSGDVLYHLTFIDDLVEGIRLCGEHPAAANQTYILAGARYTTVRELAEIVANAMGRKIRRGRIPAMPVKAAAMLCEALCKPLNIEPPLHRRRLDFFLKDRAFSSHKAATELGYAPTVSLAEGVDRTYRWYESQGLL
jgi:nucleoside-diphosphate-sugar epimerase